MMPQSFPTKEQIDNASELFNNLKKKEEEKNNKVNCERMWIVMNETLNKVVNSEPTSLYVEGKFGKDYELSYLSKLKLLDCKFEPTGKTPEQILKPLGVKLIVRTYTFGSTTLTYNKHFKELNIW